jgi:tripartite-type tricarboxylate transporter receptor subunit TctC
MRRRSLLAASAATCLATPALGDQPFPSRPIRLIVGFAPGGGTDIAARAISPRIGDILGQPVVVENRPGAGGNIALEAVAYAPPDGHTLMFGTVGTLVINPLSMRMPVDPQRAVVPVGLVADLFGILVVPVARPWRNVGELVAAAKAAPGALSWGHSGVGTSTQLGGLLLDRLAGLNTVPVSYRGGGLVATDLIAGRLDYSFATAPSVLPHIEAGKLRALAVPTAQRSRLLPAVPTVQEGGVADFDVASWYGILATHGTPDAAVARLSEAIRQAVADSDVTAVLNRNGLETRSSTPEQFAAAWQRESARWAPIMRESGIRPE